MGEDAARGRRGIGLQHAVRWNGMTNRQQACRGDGVLALVMR
jgi:hypothetical protein